VIHYEGHGVTVHHGDCLDVLRELPDCSVDSVVTDPPYALGFMGKAWDSPTRMLGQSGAIRPGQDERGVTKRGYDHAAPPAVFQAWCEQWAAECLRVLKPGGHLLAFGGSRTYHRLTSGVEDAGFEIRDCITWHFGSGFPKSLDVSKAIDRAAGAEREVVGTKHGLPGYSLTDGNGDHRTYSRGFGNTGSGEAECAVTAPATPDAQRWQGWGTALKPATEFIVVARKPLTGTVAATVLEHGTGALNIDACRVEHANAADLAVSLSKNPGRSDSVTSGVYGADRPQQRVNTAGRWPANVVFDEHQAAVLDEMSGERPSGKPQNRYTSGDKFGGTPYGEGLEQRTGWATSPGYVDDGGASRFYYVAKADASERPRVNGTSHPTVKPLALMRWLVRLVTPPGGTVLEPFAGSGTTVEACIVEGFQCVAIEKTDEYLPLIMARIHRRRDPVEAIKLAGEELGLFDLDGLGA
jgi:DNA modification methylase